MQLRLRETQAAPDEVRTGSGSDRVTRSPIDRVRLAIQHGDRTQKQIRLTTGLNDDEVGDALARLLLWTREIKSELVDDQRHYSLSNSTTTQESAVARKGDIKSGFASIRELMPGRITLASRKAG